MPFEFMLNALRLKNGVGNILFEERTGLTLSSIQSILTKLKKEGFLENTDTLIKTTPIGFLHLNTALTQFMA